MQRRHWLGIVLASLGCAATAGAQETPNQRLDALLAKWRGQTAERLREVWGREQATEKRGENTVVVYEKRKRLTATLGGIAVTPNGGARCIVRFEIGAANEVLRAARQGGGQECWSVWRGLDP
jgi:hypothetical protein